ESVGLASFLAGTSGIKDVIHKTEIANLYLIPCGIIPPNPGELILSSRFKSFIGLMREYFDYVIIDSPPLSHVSDGRILATATDTTVLVIKASSTSRHLLKRSVQYLRETHCRIAGAVLNDWD